MIFGTLAHAFYDILSINFVTNNLHCLPACSNTPHSCFGSAVCMPSHVIGSTVTEDAKIVTIVTINKFCVTQKQSVESPKQSLSGRNAIHMINHRYELIK